MSVQNMGINYALSAHSDFTVALLEGKEQVAVIAGTDSDHIFRGTCSNSGTGMLVIGFEPQMAPIHPTSDGSIFVLLQVSFYAAGTVAQEVSVPRRSPPPPPMNKNNLGLEQN